jgi:hypothetical protein
MTGAFELDCSSLRKIEADVLDTARSGFCRKTSATIVQTATPIGRGRDRLGRSHSLSFDHRRRPETLRTAIATAFF